MTTNGGDLVPVHEAPALPAPAFTGAEMGQALHAYQEMQQALDKAMPDQLMQIQGRVFRKKGYWRTVARAFRLRVECLKEERISGDEDWGFAVTYRAFTPSGDQADGDGACSASEKAAGNDTLHNVRSHAHTRAYNRAVSNLVGFGEVSAEECERDAPHREPAEPRFDTRDVSKAQVKAFWAACSERAKQFEGVSKADIGRAILLPRGIEHSDKIPVAAFDGIMRDVENWDVPGTEPPLGDEDAQREAF